MIKIINRENLFDRLIGNDHISIDVFLKSRDELSGYLIFEDDSGKFGIEVVCVLRPESNIYEKLRDNFNRTGKYIHYFEGGEKIFFNAEKDFNTYEFNP